MTTRGPASAEYSPVSECQVSSVLAAGRQTMLMTVTDYDYANINPSPIKLQKEMELLEEFLSPRKLQVMTGVDDLDTVEYLEMRVNTDQMSLGNFGMYVPNLSQMKLSGSYIPTIRDLGTSLWNLQVLWMPQCGLACLDGLVTMSALRELYLAYNEIEDISSCGMLEQLEILDLEGNRVADSGDLHYLTMCRRLARLTLEGNPVCEPRQYAGLATDYRQTVLELVPQLDFLDDVPRDCDERAAASSVCAGDGPGGGSAGVNAAAVGLDHHWDFINSMLLEVGLLAESARAPDQSGSSSSTPADSGRPPSSGPVRPGTGARPGSAAGRRPLTGRAAQDADLASADDPLGGPAPPAHRLDDSSLTAGPLVCGSITQSLRRRPDDQTRCRSARRVPEGGWTARRDPPPHQQGSLTARTPRNLDLEESCEAVLKELGQWRRDYEISRAQIEQQKAPQVLTIECGDDDPHSSPMKQKSSRLAPAASRRVTGSTRPAQPEAIVTAPPLEAGMKKLNPIRGGPSRAAPPKQTHQSAWPPPATLTRFSRPASPPAGEEALIQAGVVTEKPPPVQTSQTMSRMRRQLLESCALSSITPSKPLLKR